MTRRKMCFCDTPEECCCCDSLGHLCMPPLQQGVELLRAQMSLGAQARFQLKPKAEHHKRWTYELVGPASRCPVAQWLRVCRSASDSDTGSLSPQARAHRDK